MEQHPSFRVYVIGRVQEDSDEQTFTTFAEYRTARGLSRIQISKANFDSLLEQIGNLKSFIEGGAPEFEKEALKTLGSRLFEMLLVGKTRDLFFTATGEHAQGTLLPLEIIAEDPEVAGWPWEYLYNSNAESFISQEFNPISRSIFTATKPSTCGPISGKVRMLLILGVPPDDAETTPKEEIKYISEVFSTQLDDSRFDIDILNAEEYKKIVTKLASRRYDIVHYFGHAGFDYKERLGYLSIKRPGRDGFKVDANAFALTLRNRGIRLVFLNACKTATGAPTENPARSSIAAALLDRGIPAVIASQFSLPDNSAHFLAATIYNTLLTGKPIGDAIRDGRTAVYFADAAKFFDWGIPVLYSTTPSQVILPVVGKKPEWAEDFGKAVESGTLIETLAARNMPGGAPSLVAERTLPKRERAKYKVASNRY